MTLQLYSRHRSALGLVKLHSLGGDNSMPGGLHARICHAFIVISCHNLTVFFSSVNV